MADPDGQDVGLVLRRWRAERSLSRAKVAAALGVTERTVVRWEAGEGRPRQGDLDRLEALWPAPVDIHDAEPYPSSKQRVGT